MFAKSTKVTKKNQCKKLQFLNNNYLLLKNNYSAPAWVTPARVFPARVAPARMVPVRVAPARVVPARVAPIRVTPARVARSTSHYLSYCFSVVLIF